MSGIADDPGIFVCGGDSAGGLKPRTHSRHATPQGRAADAPVQQVPEPERFRQQLPLQ